MAKRIYIFSFVLVLLAGCSSPNFKPALAFEIPETELPLAEPGPYEFGHISNIETYDESRDNRKVTFSIYYPSINGEPDSRGAPFPLIISDEKMLTLFGNHLASHGFVVVGSSIADESEGEEVIHQPLDFMFILNQLAEDPPDILANLIDTDHVGVWGYSGGGRVALTLADTQIDPDYFSEICENPKISDVNYGDDLRWICEPNEEWDQLIEEAGSLLVETEDGLLQTIGDERIAAVIPMSSGGEWLFGATGLASADTPVLFTVGTREGWRLDDMRKMFQEYGGEEKTFITFKDQNHMMITFTYAPKRMQHLAVAFFSYHLKGDDAYAFYYSEEFISQVEGLDWGWNEE